MKYVVEYLGGCKGDLLVRSLLGDTISMTGYNKTDPRPGYGLKKFMWRKHMDDEELEITLSDLIKYTEDISPAHQLSFINNSYHIHLLNRYQIKIKKILFGPRFYRTIHIENVFKNLHHHIPDLESGPESPAEKLDNLLSVGLKFYDNFNSLDSSYGRTLWSYENLYINFYQRDELFREFDWDYFSKNVERSWLPESIDLYGETWKPKQYGYRQY